MITVITPTIRQEALIITRRALENQDADFEWIVCSPFKPENAHAIWIRDVFDGGYWSLNRAYDAMLRAAKGDIIVSWQDSIWAPPDTVSRLAEQVVKTGAFVSSVGGQYDALDGYGRPTHKVWEDPRKNDRYGTFYEVNFDDIEYNLCAFPKKACEDVGGLHVELDFLGYGLDMYQLSDRANDIGYRFFIDQSIESRTFRHEREYAEWDTKHLMKGGYERFKREKEAGKEWIIKKS